jgi:hypothetical protein
MAGGGGTLLDYFGVRAAGARTFLDLVSNTNTHAARTRTGAHEAAPGRSGIWQRSAIAPQAGQQCCASLVTAAISLSVGTPNSFRSRIPRKQPWGTPGWSRAASASSWPSLDTDYGSGHHARDSSRY